MPPGDEKEEILNEICLECLKKSNVTWHEYEKVHHTINKDNQQSSNTNLLEV